MLYVDVKLLCKLSFLLTLLNVSAATGTVELTGFVMIPKIA